MKKKRFLMIVLLVVPAIWVCWAGPVAEKSSKPDVAACPEGFAPSAPSAAQTETGLVDFEDSLGRIVKVPAKIGKVAVSGPLAQIAVFAICPDELAGVARAWDPEAREFIAQKYLDLPILGQLYGGKGDLNLESLLAAGVEVVIDVGEPKKSAREDLDRLQAQTGIPFVHITGSLGKMGEAYGRLGALLGKPELASRLAACCQRIWSLVNDVASKAAPKARLLYILGADGLHAVAKGSFQGEVIELLADNVAVVDHPSAKGTGNQIDLEQVLIWDPDIVVFSPESIGSLVAGVPVWKEVGAIKAGRYLESPIGPYNWMGFPPSVQRYLGLLWLAKVLYPQEAGYDLYEEVRTYFDLFYHCDLSREKFWELVGGQGLGGNAAMGACPI